MILKFISLLFIALFLGACGNANSTNATDTNTSTPFNTQPQDNVDQNSSSDTTLSAVLNAQARTANSVDEFTLESLKVIVPKIIQDALPNFIEGYALKLDFLSAQSLSKNSSIKSYLQEYYEKVTSSRTTNATVSSEEVALVSKIVAAIKEIVLNWFKSFIGGDASNDSSTEGNYTIDPTLPVGFSIDMLKDKTFYIISSVADMTINMDADGSNGKGSVGIISMNFSTTINENDEIIIDTSLMGQYKVVMSYRDPNYCIATQLYDIDGKEYHGYWFSNKSDMKKATSVNHAKTLCHVHSANYVDPFQAVDEGEVTPIADIRDHHTPVTVTDLSIKESVNALLNENNNSLTNSEDAKYFSRQLRHGPLSLYTTNQQPYTLQSQETENVMRELMPLAASNAIDMQTMTDSATQMASSFQKEVNDDLNSTIHDIKGRIQALSEVAASALDSAVASKNRGSATSTYGDTIEFVLTNIDVDICLVFFMCQSSASADVYMHIENNGTNGNFADIVFSTSASSTSTNLQDIKFNKIVSPQENNMISGANYALDVSDFQYVRNSGELTLKGDGQLSGSKTDAQTEVSLDTFNAKITLSEYPALNFSLAGVEMSILGTIVTADGRNFNGELMFNGLKTKSNEMDGTLKGINEEPTIEGSVKTSLTYNDIDVWKNGYKHLSQSNGLAYFVKPNGSLELIETITNSGWVRALNFEKFNNTFDCEEVNSSELSCSNFNNDKRKINFLKETEVLLIDTKYGQYYVIDIQNIDSYSLTTLILMEKETRKIVQLSAYDYDDAEVTNVRIRVASPNEPSTINNIGDQSFNMHAKISKGDDYLRANMLMIRDEAKDSWEYTILNLDAHNAFGSMRATTLNFLQTGENQIINKLQDIITTGSKMSTDIDSILTMAWNSLDTIKEFTVEDFKVTMHASSGEAIITNNSTLHNRGTNIIAHSQMSYAYGNTQLSSENDFNISIENVEEKKFTNAFTSKGHVTSDVSTNLHYALDYTKEQQYLLLTREDTGYQMGFSMDSSSAKGADSYGVKADFTMNDTFDTLEYMELKTSSNERLGEYQRSSDALKVYFSDESSEYLYVYQ